MELEKGAYPPKGDAPGLAATSPQDIENPSAPQRPAPSAKRQ
jgi:hypothetical protein